MLNLTITPRLKPFAYHVNKLGLQYIFRKFWRFVREKLSKSLFLMYRSRFFAFFTLNRIIDFPAMDRCFLRRRYTKTNFTPSYLNDVNLDVIANHNRFILMSAEYQHFKHPISFVPFRVLLPIPMTLLLNTVSQQVCLGKSKTKVNCMTKNLYEYRISIVELYLFCYYTSNTPPFANRVIGTSVFRIYLCHCCNVESLYGCLI